MARRKLQHRNITLLDNDTNSAYTNTEYIHTHMYICIYSVLMNVPYVLQMPKGVKNTVWGFQALE